MKFRRKSRIRYYYDFNPNRKGKAATAAIAVVGVIVIVIGLVFAAIWFDAKRLAQQAGPSKATAPKTLSYEVETDTFTTKYFEMETPVSWEFIEKSSSPNKFVYYNFRHKLVRGTITVYVNQPPAPEHQRATRLLTARVGVDGFLKPDLDVSDHCNKVAPGKNRVGGEDIKFKGIAFPCDNDATWYSALVGLDGGSTAMNIKRPDGTTAQYIIYYTNPSAEMSGTDFVEVMRKFKIL